MSVKEARKILDKEAISMTDGEIRKIVSDLEFLASYAINQLREKIND